MTDDVKQILSQKPIRKRPTWDEYFMIIVDATASRATCNRARSGAVITLDNKIISTGYVGSAPGEAHCDDAGHLYEEREGKKHCVRTRGYHAEQNAFRFIPVGVSVERGTLYCTMTPCRQSCAPLVVQHGIKRVVAKYHYHAEGPALAYLKEHGVRVEHVNDSVAKYENQ